jgi:hypothetical protein
MKKLMLVLALCLCSGSLVLNAQMLKGKETNVQFFSETPMENISATNKYIVLMLKPATNALQILVHNKGFTFEKPLMQEHFHENYMETEKYPESKFVGTIVEKVDYTKDGEYPVTAKGKLTIHGVTKEVEIKGKIKIVNGIVSLEAKFPVKVADYGIKVPSLVTKNIAEVVDVTITSTLENFTPPKK